VGLIGRGGGGASAPPSLADLLARGAKACARRLASAGPWRVALSIETTEHEIVDVEVVDSSSAALGVCVEEASWAHDLPMAAWPGRKTHTVVLSG